jgi:hypothetical protein
MYLILVYIIIAFFFYLFIQNVRTNIVEGQTLESYNYNEFQPIINDSIINEQVQKHLNVYNDDLNKILKKEVKQYGLDEDIINREKNAGKQSENILYDIYVKDVLGELNNTQYDEKSYENYVNNYVNFKKNMDDEKQKKYIPYSKEQLNLFKNKYKKDILYSNEYDYMDIDEVNDKIKKVNDEIKQQNGSYLYVSDGVNFPGFISESRGKVINNMVDSNASGIVLNNLEFCCDYSMLNLENQYILSESELNKIDVRIRDTLFEDDGEESKKHYEYNYPYYTYMKGNDRIYDSLYLNYNKNRNIGSINL